MKFCTKCGAQLPENCLFCPGCGSATYLQDDAQPQCDTAPSGLSSVAKAFMIVGTVCMSLAFLLIPLIWCLPMTISYFNKVKTNKPVSIGFKVCTLLFVNTIAGILMLCDNKN